MRSFVLTCTPTLTIIGPFCGTIISAVSSDDSLSLLSAMVGVDRQRARISSTSANMFSIDPLSILPSTIPGRSEGMLQFMEDSSELSLLERTVTAFEVGVDTLRRWKILEENSVEGVTASEFRRVPDLPGDLLLVKVNRRLSLSLLVRVFSALLASSGLSVKERDDCLQGQRGNLIPTYVSPWLRVRLGCDGSKLPGLEVKEWSLPPTHRHLVYPHVNEVMYTKSLTRR